MILVAPTKNFFCQYYGSLFKYKLFNVISKDMVSIESQIHELLSKYCKWSETELFKRRDENNQVCDYYFDYSYYIYYTADECKNEYPF